MSPFKKLALNIATKIIPVKNMRYKIYNKIAEGHFQKYKASLTKLDKIKISTRGGEKIYSVWFQGEESAPKLIHSCFDSIRKHCSQKLIVLDEKTLPNYIDLPGVIMDKYKNGQIRKAAFSDIARVELLHNHGGFWMDATSFMLDKIPETIAEQDFYTFVQRPENNPQWWAKVVVSHFIRARKGSYLLAAWRELTLNYWRDADKAFNYFWLHMLFKALAENDDKAKKLFEKMPREFNGANWNQIANKKFDEKIWNDMLPEIFLLKTSYRNPMPDNLVPGSFADFIINGKSAI